MADNKDQLENQADAYNKATDGSGLNNSSAYIASGITDPAQFTTDTAGTPVTNPGGYGKLEVAGNSSTKEGTSPAAATADDQVIANINSRDQARLEAAGVTPLLQIPAIPVPLVTEVVTEGSDFLSASDIRDANETTVFAGDPYADNQDDEQFLSASDVVGNDETTVFAGDPAADAADNAFDDPFERERLYAEQRFLTEPGDVSEEDPFERERLAAEGRLIEPPPDIELSDADRKAAVLAQAQAQQTIAEQRGNKNNGDWRVRLRLAPLADYLYKAQSPGILSPLTGTDGVLFPYTPTIQTGYKANYSTADITHSNYRGYFYQGSVVEPVIISCPFTAQDTAEANYLLAVIHFFKSVTKMFYGQDPQRGSPPPVVYLTGLGEFQFNEHPCVVTSFTYDLPADVDYIRTRSPNVNNSNMLQQRQANNPTAPSILGGFLGGAIGRLASSKLFNGQSLPKGGMTTMPAPQSFETSTQPTYVPTKMTISITLLPIISRQAQSQKFSLRQYANGDLLKGGMW